MQCYPAELRAPETIPATELPTPLKMKLTAITLDCPDPRALAAFYQEATGLDLHPGSGGDFAGLTRQDGLFIGFQRADGHQAPTWPNQNVPQRSHLDFAVDDLDEAEARVAERLGEHVLPSAGARV